MEVIIRPMMSTDVDNVVANENTVYEFPWTRALFESNLQRHFAIVAVSLADNAVVGHALLSTVMDEAHILNIAVVPTAQRCGVGRQLLEELLDYARHAECAEAFLEVRASNRPAFTFYHSLGFNEIGVRSNYYPIRDGREDAILLACPL